MNEMVRLVFLFTSSHWLLSACRESRQVMSQAGKLYAPPGKLQLIYFVDDLNMPALDSWLLDVAFFVLSLFLFVLFGCP